ncbi:MAG: peptide deformylase [Rhodospirillaceae bacterium]|jgi:peptide deformylase|nr:peptide deformylase [Rhodospirillaceae bacterium]MBT6118590.1 peptide deformylase [Rhodospirillaceae bacterium]
MAIRKIARMGADILREPAKPVADPTAPAVRALVRDMLETMADAEGAGLAAPQINEPWRIVIFHVPRARAAREGQDGDAEVPLTILCNPEIEVLSDEEEWGWEACLSVPGLMGMVPRATRIHYRGVTPEGERVEREAEGFHARVVQHECDHLDGILYPQRMTDLSLLGFAEEFHRAPPELGGEIAESGEEEAA